MAVELLDTNSCNLEWDNPWIASGNEPATIACWMQITSISASLNFPLILATEASGSRWRIAAHLWQDTSQRGFWCGSYDALGTHENLQWDLPAGAWAVDEWHHFAVVHTGQPFDSTVFRVFLDGVDQGAPDVTSGTSVNDPILSANKFHQGRNVSGAQRGDNRSADLAYWNRELSDGEIAALAAGLEPKGVPNGLKFAPTLVRAKEDYNISGVGIFTENNATVFDHPTEIIRVPQIQSVSLPAAFVAPSIPLNPTATPGNEQATSGCDASTGTAPITYNLYHSASSPVTTGDTKVTSADRTGEVVTGLTNGVPHYFAWTAENAQGESAISVTVSATPAVQPKYTPTLALSDAQLVGSWRIDQMTVSQPTASMRMKEDRAIRNVKLPKRNFTRDLYPLADDSAIGQAIPCLIGKGFSLSSFLIDRETKRFKNVDHGLVSYDDFKDENGDAFIPDTIFLSSGEFIYTGWDGESDLFVDATATGENPVDAVEIILTDTERGASVSSSRLDTTSTGKGFGSTGARVKYIRGSDYITKAELVDFAIGLYMKEVQTVEAWIKEVASASFGTVFVNRSDLWQYKAWLPEQSADLQEIRTFDGKPRYTWKMESPVTRALVRYAEQHGTEGVQAYEHKDDWLRQKRNLSEHASKEVTLPLSDLFSARYWAERTVATRGVPRRVLSFRTTQEHKELEIADFVRVVNDDLNLDTVFEVLTVSITTGDHPVALTLIDVRGFGDTAGFYADDADPAWDDSWTDAEVIEKRENSAFWNQGGGYADTDDAKRSHNNTVYV